MAEAAVLLLGVCWGFGSLMQGCSEAYLRVFGVLFVSTPSLILFGELVIGAYRRARYRNAVLAYERQEIMKSVVDAPKES